MTSEALRMLLRDARTIAVVGLSPKPSRPSHAVARYLQASGYHVVPVNPEHASILGEKSYPTLTAAAAEHAIDVVDVFRRSEFAASVVDEALRVRPRLIWLQLGVLDETAPERAATAGIPLVMDRCLMVDHQALGV
ncbi:MAG TPA: CoA-binding protein [Gemmatimonadales bacterium]|nr:CoA-binding protein [Gemmatimonadales bacterium]